MSSSSKTSLHENRSNTRQSVAALTAMIMAQGLASTAQASPASEWKLADARGESVSELPRVDVAGEKPKTLASPKFTVPQRDTPQTVIVVPREVYIQQGATSLSDVLRNTSGITFAAGEGGGASGTSGDSFYIRGFDATNNIFVDGVRDVGAYSRDVFNLEQVEVVKGPAGTDIGRGGASGYVNVATKTPRLGDFTDALVTYGFDEAASGSRKRAIVDVNQSSDTLAKGAAIRVNALWQDSDIAGRQIANNESWGIAPSLALGLKSPTKAYLAYQHVEQDNVPDYGLPTAQLPGYISPVPVPRVDWSTYYGFTSDYDTVNSDMAMLRVEHALNRDLKLSNQTRYSANQRNAIITTPGTSGTSYVPATNLLTRSRQGNKRDASILSNQTNLSGHVHAGKIEHNFSGGIEVAREKLYSPAFTSVSLTAIPIQSPDANGIPSGSPPRSGGNTNVDTKTAAIYAFDTIKFNRHWQINASLRTEHYKTHFVSVTPGAATVVVDAKDDLLSYKTGLVYKPTRSGNIYLAYATSLTPPGTDFTLSSVTGNQNNPDTSPQETSNIELGVKWDFFHSRLSTNAAVFKTVNDKTVFTDPILGPIPAGKQTVQGAEVGLSRRFTANWIVLGSISYLDSEINSGTTAGGNLAGSALPLIPKWSGNLFTSYRFSSGLIIGGGGNYSSEIARRDNNNPAVPRNSPSYWLFNALASYPVTKTVSIRFNVNNLFDRQFVQSLNNNGGRFNPGAPRAYLLTAEVKF